MPHFQPEIGPAAPDELPAAAALLRTCGLSPEGLDGESLLLLVARWQGRPQGCIALESHGDEAVLLRSLAVEPALRGRGLGARLLDAALALAGEAGVRHAALLTEGAADFFALRGFRPVARAQLPAALQASAQLRGACPDSAGAMLRELHGGLRVRPAVEADMAAVLGIYNHEVEHSSSTYQYALRTLEEQCEILMTRRRDGDGFFVAGTPDGRVVGYSSYGLFRPREGWRFSCEHAVYLHPDWRGRGIGRLLLPPVMAHARRRGFHTMVGVVDASNTASVRLHEALGFRVAGVLKEGGYKFDRWLDVAFVQAML
ncbi:GNAT family N-acetyltransferase [Caldimonas tepidiphila]|uniref:GNAT family N-acetyltransferase n=1 Tax=Caldimonas tepidiphila TaxID=2315841 RepID=UPI0014733F67|nr:GNAT family N-acetyltransferase [Caldimonas tepidiphila]